MKKRTCISLAEKTEEDSYKLTFFLRHQKLEEKSKRDRSGLKVQFKMLGHKMVPKYMKELEMKCDVTSYKRDEKKCIASGQRALLNYNRVIKHGSSFKCGNSAVFFYIKESETHNEIEVFNSKGKKKTFQIDPNARAAQRKKETSI